MRLKSIWNYGSYVAVGTDVRPDAIVVVDGDDAGCDSIYFRYGILLSPIRTICREPRDRWRALLKLWGERAPLHDCRKDKSVLI